MCSPQLYRLGMMYAHGFDGKLDISKLSTMHQQNMLDYYDYLLYKQQTYEQDHPVETLKRNDVE